MSGKLQSLWRRRDARRHARNQAAGRPGLEALEARAVPSTGLNLPAPLAPPALAQPDLQPGSPGQITAPAAAATAAQGTGGPHAAPVGLAAGTQMGPPSSTAKQVQLGSGGAAALTSPTPAQTAGPAPATGNVAPSQPPPVPETPAAAAASEAAPAPLAAPVQQAVETVPVPLPASAPAEQLPPLPPAGNVAEPQPTPPPVQQAVEPVVSALTRAAAAAPLPEPLSTAASDTGVQQPAPAAPAEALAADAAPAPPSVTKQSARAPNDASAPAQQVSDLLLLPTAPAIEPVASEVTQAAAATPLPDPPLTIPAEIGPQQPDAATPASGAHANDAVTPAQPARASVLQLAPAALGDALSPAQQVSDLLQQAAPPVQKLQSTVSTDGAQQQPARPDPVRPADSIPVAQVITGTLQAATPAAVQQVVVSAIDNAAPSPAADAHATLAAAELSQPADPAPAQSPPSTAPDDAGPSLLSPSVPLPGPIASPVANAVTASGQPVDPQVALTAEGGVSQPESPIGAAPPHSVGVGATAREADVDAQLSSGDRLATRQAASEEGGDAGQLARESGPAPADTRPEGATTALDELFASVSAFLSDPSDRPNSPGERLDPADGARANGADDWWWLKLGPARRRILKVGIRHDLNAGEDDIDSDGTSDAGVVAEGPSTRTGAKDDSGGAAPAAIVDHLFSLPSLEAVEQDLEGTARSPFALGPPVSTGTGGFRRQAHERASWESAARERQAEARPQAGGRILAGTAIVLALATPPLYETLRRLREGADVT